VAHDLSSIIGVVTMADGVSTERTECFAIRVEYEERSEFWHWRTVPTEKGYQDNQQYNEASSSKCTLRSRPCTYVDGDVTKMHTDVNRKLKGEKLIRWLQFFW